MARIVHTLRKSELFVNGRMLFGRAASCDGVLSAGGASKEHASVDWNGANWVLRDLGSRNGTRINDTPLAGREWLLAVGDRIAFGDPLETWTWVDGMGPVPGTVLADGRRVWGTSGFLALPDETKPTASVYTCATDWVFDDGQTTRVVKNGESVEVGGELFVLLLPDVVLALERTMTVRVASPLSVAVARFVVSADEDFVEVHVGVGTPTRKLPSRAYGYMLLTLARARDADRRAGVTPAESGWVYADDLANQLVTTREKLNVDVHRARHLLAQLGLFADPENVVERRNGQVRLGIAELFIERTTGQ